jgi:ABC-type sugar transport system substrate-binding protein
LAPREASILCRFTHEKFIKKGGKIITKEGGLGQYPQESRKQNRKKKIQETTGIRKKQIREACN